MSNILKRKLALARLIPVYPAMVKKKDLRKVLDVSETILCNMIYSFEGLAEQDKAICFISLNSKEQAERRYEHMLAEGRQRDNGGAL